MADVHPLALALLRAEAAAYRASEGVTGAHPDDPPHPAMAAARARLEWVKAGCPVEEPTQDAMFRLSLMIDP